MWPRITERRRHNSGRARKDSWVDTHDRRRSDIWWENGKLKCPTISLARTSETWAYFETRWGEYRDGTRLQGDNIVVQLLECCDDELRRDLTRSNGGSIWSEVPR